MGRRIEESFFITPFLSFLKSMIFVVIITISIMGYLYIKNAHISTLSHTLSSTLISCNKNINTYFEFMVQATSQLSKAPEIAEFVNNSETKEKLTDFLSQNTNNEYTVIILDAEKKPLFATDGQLPIYANEVLQASLQSTLIIFRPDVSDFFFHPKNNDWVLFITEPIIWQKELVGFVALEVSLKDIEKIVTQYSMLMKTSEIYVGKKFDSEIKTLFPTRFHPDVAFKNIDMLQKPLQKIMQSATIGKQGTTQTVGLLVAWNYIPLTQWGIMMVVSQKEISRHMLLLKIILTIIVVICLLAISYFIYRTWTNTYGPDFFKYLLIQVLFYTLHSVLLITIISLVLHVSHHYHGRQRYAHKNTVDFKIALHTAIQKVNTHTSAIEMVAQTLSAQLPLQAVNADTQKKINNAILSNDDIYGVVVAVKNNKKWDLSVFTRSNNEILQITDTVEESTTPWLKSALVNSATWQTYEANKEIYPLFTIQINNRSEKKDSSTQALLGILFKTSTLLATARTVVPHQPLFLALTDGSIVYADKSRGMPSGSISVGQELTGKLITERMPHIGWYLGSIIPKVPISIAGLLLLLLNVIIMCSAIAVLLYSLVYCMRWHTALLPLCGLLIAIVLLIIQHWL